MAKERSATQLLDEYGKTYAAEAGIRLQDKPSPLYQLLVLTTLMSARIRADIAVAAAREIFRAGWRTPQAMLKSTWQQRVDALGRGGYARYDESTARYLEAEAQLLIDKYQGDLRKMRATTDSNIAALRRRLKEFPRIGDVGADIFCREVQMVWPQLRPYFDRRALGGAKHVGLPTDAKRLAKMVGNDDIGRLAVALVRVQLEQE
jgi:hypothetical protein